MSSAWLTLKEHLAQHLGHLGDVKIRPDDFTEPPRPELGDIALPCFRMAKEAGMSPVELAQKIAGAFSSDHFIASLEAAGPFVNLRFHAGALADRIVRDVEHAGDAYGASTIGGNRRVLFEYACPNTHKELHVGHLRNVSIGASLVRVLRHAGYDVVPVNYMGDIGAHVAKCLWWFLISWREQQKSAPLSASTNGSALGFSMEEFHALLESFPESERTGKRLGELYAESSRQLEAREGSAEQISAVLQSLEKGDPAWHAFWEETRRWSLDEMNTLFKELGAEFDRIYLESEVTDEGQKIVDTLMKQGIATVSQGAVIVDLESQKLGVFLVRKSDGTALYSTKELALAYLKQREYPTMEDMIVLVDNRQSQYFRQLFATLKLMGFSVPMRHLGYEFVTLASGAMSSREGNVITYQAFREELMKAAWKSTVDRHPDWSEGKVTYTAWALAMSAMKFGMLRQDPDKVYTFDMNEALSFEGDTGPYVQYASVRLQAILRKAAAAGIVLDESADVTPLALPQEVSLVLGIAKLAEILPKAAEQLKPSIIANWCVEMARASNAFYRDVPVMDAPEKERAARLRLVRSAHRTLALGMSLLGVPMPEEM